MIGIIGAMDAEVSGLIARLENARSRSICGIQYHLGTLKGEELVVAKSGVGKVNAAVCAQTMILEFKPELIINTGVGGGIGPGLEVCDVVVATYAVQHDMDTSALGDPIGFISGPDIIRIPCPEETAGRLAQAAEDVGGFRVHRGGIASGDQFISSAEKGRRIYEDFGAIACDMEGGAIAQACMLAGVPCGIVRAVSDNGDEAAAMDFPRFLEKAVPNSLAIIERFLEVRHGA